MINKNFKNTDFRNVTITATSSAASISGVTGSATSLNLLSDLINDSSQSIQSKVIASVFLLVKRDVSDLANILLLKPECLWLKIDGGTLKDYYGRSSDIIPSFESYKESEVLKATFLIDPKNVYSILTGLGVTSSSAAAIGGLKNIFMYDLNQANRIRAIAAGPSNNITAASRWA